MFEILVAVEKIVWIIVFMFIAIAESLFCIQLVAVQNKYKRVKKELSLSSNNGHNGHRGRPQINIKNDLANLKLEFISWSCIAVACAYALLDCFLTHIIK